MFFGRLLKSEFPKKSFIAENRLVGLDRTDYVDPLMNADEEREARRTAAVEVEKLMSDVYQGLHITDDQAVEAPRLGVREDLLDRYRRWFPEVDAQDLPVNERINFALRSRSAEIVSERRRREGFWATRWRAGRGFLRNVRNLFRTSGGLIEQERAERYGEVENIPARRQHLAALVWNNLNAAEQVLVNAQLNAMTVPIPPAVPAGVAPNIMRLANLDQFQLEELRNALTFLDVPMPGPLFPSRRDITPANHFQALEEFVSIQGTERKKALVTTIYDTQRLQARIDRLEVDDHDVYTLLVDDILETDAFYNVENNPAARALMAYLEWRLDGTTTGNLQAELENIRDNLPRQAARQAEGQEETDEQRQIERAQELSRNIAKMHEQLADKYIEADTQGAKLYAARSTAAHTAAPAAPAGGGAPPVDTGYRQARETVTKYEDQSSSMQADINKLERKFGQTVREMLNMLNGANAIPANPADAPNLAALNTSPFGLNPGGGAPGGAPPALPGLSDSDQLFGPTDYPPGGGAAPAAPVARPARGGATGPSAFMTAINNLSSAQMSGLEGEIKAQAEQGLAPRVKVDCKQLLFLLKEGDLARRGITNEEQRSSHALLSTNLMIAEVENEQMFRQTNQELMELRAGATWGSHRLDRMRKQLIANLTGGVMDNFMGQRIFKTRDLVDYISGFDKDFAMFKGMSKDITLAELRDHIDHHGGISSAKLFEFATKLREVFMSFEMMGQEGQVEFFDDEAVDMETLINNLLIVRAELRSRNFFEEVRGMEGTKAEIILRKIREDEEAQDQEEKGILEQVADKAAGWKQWFSRKVLGKEFGGKYEEARKFIKEQGMSKQEANDYLSMEGLASAASVLGTAYTIKEWAGVGRKAARWTAASGGTGLGKLWSKTGKPVLKYGVGKPLEYLIWKPAKWTVTTAGKTIAFPFALAGSIGAGYWNWATGKKAENPT